MSAVVSVCGVNSSFYKKRCANKNLLPSSIIEMICTYLSSQSLVNFAGTETLTNNIVKKISFKKWNHIAGFKYSADDSSGSNINIYKFSEEIKKFNTCLTDSEIIHHFADELAPVIKISDLRKLNMLENLQSIFTNRVLFSLVQQTFTSDPTLSDKHDKATSLRKIIEFIKEWKLARCIQSDIKRLGSKALGYVIKNKKGIDVSMLKILLENGADPNEETPSHGYLMDAPFHELIKQSIDTDLPYCNYENIEPIMDLFLEHGVNISPQTIAKPNILRYVFLALRSHHQYFKGALESNEDISKIERQFRKIVKITKYLLIKGANFNISFNIRDREGRSLVENLLPVKIVQQILCPLIRKCYPEIVEDLEEIILLCPAVID